MLMWTLFGEDQFYTKGLKYMVFGPPRVRRFLGCVGPRRPPPKAPGARRGPRGAENRPKAQALIFHLIVPKVRLPNGDFAAFDIRPGGGGSVTTSRPMHKRKLHPFTLADVNHGNGPESNLKTPSRWASVHCSDGCVACVKRLAPV